MTHRKPRIDKFGHIHPPRHSVGVRLLVTAAILLAIGLAAHQGLGIFTTSIEHYEPPAMPPIEAGRGTTPVAQRAVFLIVSGLRDDVSREMPALESLRQQGAAAEAQAPWPTTYQTTWTTLVSGATPELSGAVDLTASDEVLTPITIDHLLRRARVMRRTTALLGHERWRAMIAAGELTNTVFAAGRTSEDDARLIRQAADMLATTPPDLMVIQLSEVDTAGQSYGGASDKYYRAAQRADELIRRLVSVVDLENTLLVITSDYGHLDAGGHGGTEEIVADVPFLIVGPGVAPGRYNAIDQSDVAPTLAALLGLPIPAESEGIVRFEMLNLEMPLRAEKAITLAEQQIRLSDAYLRTTELGAVSGAPIQKLSVARSAQEIGNAQGAFEIARQGEQGARRERAAGRQAGIAGERQDRLALALGGGALFITALILLRSGQTAWLLGAGLLAWLGPLGNADALTAILDAPELRWTPALAGALMALAAVLRARRRTEQEHRSGLVIAGSALVIGCLFTLSRAGSFSPSVISGGNAFYMTMAGQSIIALLIGGFGVLSWTWPVGLDFERLTRASYWFVCWLVAGLLLQLAIGYWLLGLRVIWYLPEADLVSWHAMGLMQTMMVAGFGILLPAVIAPIALALHQRSRQPASGDAKRTPEVGRMRP